MKCNRCGADNEENAKFCNNCGVILDDDVVTEVNNKFCPKCGANNDPDSRFCIVCGLPLNKTSNKGTSEIANDRSDLAKWSLILGIISTVCGVLCCCGFFYIPALLTGIAAIVLAGCSMKSSQRSKAIAGLILGIIGLFFGLIMLIIAINSEAILEYMRVNYPDIWEQYESMYESSTK